MKTESSNAAALLAALRQATSPLSDCQQRVWRLAMADPQTVWAERIAQRLSGPVRLDVLTRTFDALIRRHAILRTVFLVMDGRPVQCVRSTARQSLLVVDLQAVPAAHHDRLAARVVNRCAHATFDLRRGPLMRALLIQLGPAEHVLSMTLHHLIFDGWSQGVMFQELMTLFMAFSLEFPSPLPPLRVQYSDLARREQAPSREAERRARLAECVGRLQDLPTPATLPLDRPRPSHTSHRAAAIPFVVSDESFHRLRAVSEAEGATTFMVGLTAFAMALRATVPAVDELVVGVALANRPSVEAQSLIGPFVNILPVRLSIAGANTARELLRRARSAMLDAFTFQDVPFDAVMEALDPGSDKGSYGPTGRPLFRICIDVTDATDPAGAGAADVAMTPFEAGEAKSGCDLYVSFAATRETLRGMLMYSAELFDRSTVSRFLDRLLATLDSLPRELDARHTEAHS
jgi:hypothetical protein